MASRFVNLNLKPHRRFRAALRAEIDGKGKANDLLTEWGRRYFSYLRDRYRVNRGGGGDWPPLKESTLKSKEKRLGILYVLGAIFNALRIGAPGNRFTKIGFGVQCGVGGPARHPGTDLTIAQLAMIHNNGRGHVPKRQILYRPDRTLYLHLRRDTFRVIARLKREALRA